MPEPHRDGFSHKCTFLRLAFYKGRGQSGVATAGRSVTPSSFGYVGSVAKRVFLSFIHRQEVLFV